MITHSPESTMDEPYRSYVRQRSQMIANIMEGIVQEQDVQLCPRAITSDDRLFDDTAITYGAVVRDMSHGDKSILYDHRFNLPNQLGIATNDEDEAVAYVSRQFTLGNRVRVKDAVESDGRGQHTIETEEDARRVFSDLQLNNRSDVVLMPHLEIQRRISVGRIALGSLGKFYYLGDEFTTQHHQDTVYGGTTLGLFHESKSDGRVAAEQQMDISPAAVSLGLYAINQYDHVALSADRVSVDVIEGYTDNGTFVRNVVDLTPRVGGTTPAEILAIQEVVDDPSSLAIARSQLLYQPKIRPSTGVNFVDTDSLIINAEVLEVRS